MSEVIIERHAHQLRVADIVELFRKLESMLRSRVKAARVCGLERKTIYDWQKTGEIKLRTKKKVLSALLEKLPEDTLDFMTKRSIESSIEILRTYLSFVYENAMNERISVDDFQRFFSKFLEVRSKYSGVIMDYLDIEVGDMLRFLSEKALDLGLKVSIRPMDVVKLSKLADIFPSFIKTLSLKPSINEIEIARNFNFPIEFVQSVSEALQESFIPTESAAHVILVHLEYTTPLNTAGTIGEYRKESEEEPMKTTSVTQGHQIASLS